jgi:hypothetical protein
VLYSVQVLVTSVSRSDGSSSGRPIIKGLRQKTKEEVKLAWSDLAEIRRIHGGAKNVGVTSGSVHSPPGIDNLFEAELLAKKKALLLSSIL